MRAIFDFIGSYGMKTGKSEGNSELGGSGLEQGHRKALAARWRSLSAWVDGELTRMRNERLDRGFLATSHGKNYRSPDAHQHSPPGERVEAEPDR